MLQYILKLRDRSDITRKTELQECAPLNLPGWRWGAFLNRREAGKILFFVLQEETRQLMEKSVGVLIFTG